MLGENHTLHHEFPEYHDLIDKLMKEDMHFKKIADEYNALDKEIRTLEQNNSPIEGITLTELKKKRSHLKDAAYQMLEKYAE